MSVYKFSDEGSDDRPHEVRFRERLGTIAVWRSLYDLGFNVIPARPQTKETCRCWKEYQEARQPRWLFNRWFLGDFRPPGTSEAMLVVGDTPGIRVVVLDGDDDEAVALIRANCPPTPMMVQTRRGYHFYFAHPGDGRIAQRTRTVIGGVRYAIDLKADGSVVAAPGSRHASGHIYEMTQNWSPEMVSGLPVYDPSWLPHEVEREHRDGTTARASTRQVSDAAHEQFVTQGWLPPVGVRVGRARRYLERVPGTRAGEGTARRECFRLALALTWGFVLSSDDAVACLVEWGRKDSNIDLDGDHDPWAEEEIAVEVRSASAATYRGQPGDKLFGA